MPESVEVKNTQFRALGDFDLLQRQGVVEEILALGGGIGQILAYGVTPAWAVIVGLLRRYPTRRI